MKAGAQMPRVILGFSAATFLLGMCPTLLAQESKSIRVPYLLTDARHVMVRAKINGKGPFNFIVDTGAPALFVGTEAAQKLGIKPDPNGWGSFERFEVEGGVLLENVKGRIEDPFQLTGMNKMNLAGHRYDGVLGYTILAKFRITYDFTESHLIWVPLQWEPPKPIGLGALGGKGAPAEVEAMASLTKIASALMGKRPPMVYIYRGLLGIELAKENGKPVIANILANSAAAQSGLRVGDRLRAVNGKETVTLDDAIKYARDIRHAEAVRITVERMGESHVFTLTAMKGL